MSDAATQALTSGFSELTLQVRDLEALERFYRGSFGLRCWPARTTACGWRRASGRAWACGCPARRSSATRAAPTCTSRWRPPRAASTAVCERLDERGVGYRGPLEHDGGDRSIYVEDPEGNVVEVWDFFERGEGRAQGVDALSDDASGSTASS